jgi:hypothetical protein
MPILSVDEIIAAKDLGEKEIEIPEWDGSVVIRGLGYGEFVTIREKANVNGEQDERIFGRLLLAAAFIDPVLTEDQADALFNKSSVAVAKISDEIVNLSGIGGPAFVTSEATFQG